MKQTTTLQVSVTLTDDIMNERTVYEASDVQQHNNITAHG
jgi:hypothetical protein